MTRNLQARTKLRSTQPSPPTPPERSDDLNGIPRYFVTLEEARAMETLHPPLIPLPLPHPAVATLANWDLFCAWLGRLSSAGTITKEAL